MQRAPNQDLCFLRMLRKNENIDKLVATATLCKLSEKINILSLFDDEANLRRDSLRVLGKKHSLHRWKDTWLLLQTIKLHISDLKKIHSLKSVTDTGERAIKHIQKKELFLLR